MQDALPGSPGPVQPAKKDPSRPYSRLRLSLPGLLFAGFSCLASYLFYAQPELRQHIASYFLDLQTRLKPASAHLGGLVVVPIAEPSLRAAHAEHVLPGPQLLDLVSQLAATQATALVLLLPENVLDYDSAAGQQIIQMIERDPRMSLGVLGYHQGEPSLRKLPKALASIKDRVFGMDMLRRRSTEVVRKLSYTSYLGLEEQLMLPVAVARRFHNLLVDPGSFYYLNFEPMTAFTTVPTSHLAEPAAMATMNGSIVVLGYTIPVAWPFMTYEQLTANTPLRFDATSLQNGESLTLVTANAIENLLHDRALIPLPLALKFIYVGILVALTLWLWRRGPIPGSIGVTVGFWLLLYAQSVCMAHFAVAFPVADAMLFAGLASMLGAWQALQLSLQGYAVERSLNERNRGIAEVRSEFLDRFADELSRINQDIGANARLLVVPDGAAATLVNARRHLQSSTDEFADYIASVVQVSRLSVADPRPELLPLDLSRLIEDVVERFALSLDDKTVGLTLTVAPGIMVRSNKNVIDKILFNFLSNAVKYSPSNTTLQIKAVATRDLVRVHVIDQGPGIAEEHQELIFEKFYRVRNDDTYRIKGSGLGLYLCRYFAGLIGARIELESKLGTGADFALVLPR